MIRLILISIFTFTFIAFSIDIYIQAIKRMSLSEKMRRSANKLYAAADGDPVLYYHPDEKNYRISAQPDEIFETKDDKLVPFLYKTSLAKYDNPPEEYIYQFVAFFKVIGEEYGREPEYGILEDLDTGKFFKINNTDDLSQAFLDASDKIYLRKTAKEKSSRNHNDQTKCSACAHRNHCTESLV